MDVKLNSVSDRSEPASAGPDDTDFNQALASTKDDPVIINQIRKTNSQITEFQERVAAAKKTQKPLPDQVDPIEPEKQGEEFGKELATTKGQQFVLIGEHHNQADEWKTLVSIIQGYEKNRNSKDKRRLIFIYEGEDNPTVGTAWREWNDTPIVKRSLLGNKLNERYGKNSEEINRYWQNQVQSGKNARYLPMSDALNYISDIRSDINFYIVDANYPMNFEGKKHIGKTKFADRDTVMAFHIDRLSKEFPDAIFIGNIGAHHVIEKSAGNNNKLNDNGVNMSHTMAKQLASLHGYTAVHTIASVPYGASFSNSEDERVYVNQNFFDKYIPIRAFDAKKDTWQNPWKNAAGKQNSFAFEDMPSHNEVIRLDPVWADDPEIKQFKAEVAKAKKKIPKLSLERDIYTWKRDAQDFGKSLAVSSGGQIVLLGYDTKQTGHWDVLTNIIETYEKTKNKTDARAIIFIAPKETRSLYAAGARRWNKMPQQERKRGALGDVLLETMQKTLPSYNNELLANGPIRALGEMEALNKLSKLRPDVSIYAVCNNENTDIYRMKDKEPIKEFNPDFADLDTSMALNIQKLREQYPDAIIVGAFHAGHIAERTKDDSAKSENLDEGGNNQNDQMAEQLSLINGDNVVRSLRIRTYEKSHSFNAYGDEIYTDHGEYDKTIFVPPADLSRWRKH